MGERETRELDHVTLGDHAVVVGAGMGGSMAAEVLSRYFDRVTVLERDALPAAAEPRMGVPQGAHTHGLLVQGRRNLEKLFPGFTSELLDRGAICSRFSTEVRSHDAFGWIPSREFQLPFIAMSRPLLEGTVRNFLKRNPRVAIRENARVEGWQYDGGRVAGIVVGGDPGSETISADVVVDATGRSGNSLAWLQAGGFGPTEETKLEIGTGYASAVFKKPTGWQNPVDVMLIGAAPPDSKGAFIVSIENDCWLVSLTGRFEEQPPGDPDKFMAYAKSLCVPDVYEWLSQGERITPIKVYKAPVSRWRHYEKLERFPSRLLPIGDSIAHVNPVYGQGMTLASVHAMGLWDTLEDCAQGRVSLDALAGPYFARVHDFTNGVWRGLENLEFTFAKTKGERPPDIDMRIAYSNGLRKLIVDDPEFHRLYLSVGHLIESASVLAQPEIVERVMKIIAPEMGAGQRPARQPSA